MDITPYDYDEFVETPGHKPEVPPRLRNIVYWVGLAVGFLSLIATGLAPVFIPALATQVVATVGVLGSATGFLASALGVAYRPYRPA